MIIYLVRHGQTDLNKNRLIQGRSDIPLNENGILQAQNARKLIGDVKFDAVYASPLKRAQTTATIVGNVSLEDVIIDERIIETDFGKYEGCKYTGMGIPMSLYWTCPEIFKAPPSVETVNDMVNRAQDFLKEIEAGKNETVLIASHGGILRSLNGYLMDRSNGIQWRPKMHNCEVRVYESVNGVHKLLDIIHTEKA